MIWFYTKILDDNKLMVWVIFELMNCAIINILYILTMNLK